MEKAKASKAKNISRQSRIFFILRNKKAFIKLKQAFVKAPILNHFDPKHYIQIETDVLAMLLVKFFVDWLLIIWANDIR